MGVLHTTMLLGTLTGILMFVGMLVGGVFGFVLALGLAVVINTFSYWYSDRIVLRMYGASPTDRKDLNDMVARLAHEAKLPKPKVYIIDKETPNAFATGRNPRHSAIAVTEGLLELDRDELEGVLARAGCQPGDLELIVITHGDFDHTGNAAYLAKTFGAKIAMHPDDAGMAERGDMFWNRQSGGDLIRTLAPLFSTLFGFGRSQRFAPDLAIEEGYDLSAHGCDARVLSLSGHSKGSIGILAADGDLFCGDLLANVD